MCTSNSRKSSAWVFRNSYFDCSQVAVVPPILFTVNVMVIAGTSNGAALTYQLLINTGADRPFRRCHLQSYTNTEESHLSNTFAEPSPWSPPSSALSTTMASSGSSQCQPLRAAPITLTHPWFRPLQRTLR